MNLPFELTLKRKVIGAVVTTALSGGSWEMTRDQFVSWNPHSLSAYSSDRIDMLTADSEILTEEKITFTTQETWTCAGPCVRSGSTINPPPPPPPPVGSQEVDWSIRAIGADIAQTKVNESSIVLAVLDTGVDLSHPDLKVRGCMNFVGGPANDCHDGVGHGTHTTGSINAQANSIGMLGGSPEVVLIHGKVLDDHGSGTQEWIANGIIWAVRSGAKVISMSLGSPQPSQIIAQAVGFAIRSGVIVVAAAGNAGNSTPNYPAQYPGVRAIAALDSNLQKANFSSFGNIWAACPGVNVKSTMPGGGYGGMSGTSMATPVCASAIALALAAGRQLKFKDLGSPKQYFGQGIPNLEATLQ